MKIPEKVKIGGLTYSVSFPDKLIMGRDFDGEVEFKDLEIRLKTQNKYMMEQVFIHEVIHCLEQHIAENWSEELITKVANALYMLIIDNPELFENG